RAEQRARLRAELAALDAAVRAEADAAVAAEHAPARARLAAEHEAAEKAKSETAAAAAAVRQQLAESGKKSGFLSRLFKGKPHGPAGAARRLLAAVPLVVGAPGSLDADPVFGAAPPDGAPPFGLLVLDHAEELAEPDFHGLARLADRWVLAGELPEHAPPYRN